MNFWKKCPLLILLLISGLFITIVSAANRNGVYGNYEKKSIMTPVLAFFFEGMKDGIYPWTGQEASDETQQNEADLEEEAAAGLSTEQEAALPEPENTEINDPAGEKEETQPQALEPETEQETESALQPDMDTSQEEPEGQEEYLDAVLEQEADREAQQETADLRPLEGRTFTLGRVEEAYFDDALFIGDSRTQGLYEYGGFGENVTFYCKTSLTVYDLFKKDRAFIKENNESITLEEALTRHSFGKIYLMIGINEMGTGTAESFFEEYARAVYKIRQLQPNALIFVQAIMNVGAKKNASDPIFNNLNIAVRNVEIATLADNQTIFYIDVNEVLCDESGNLFEGWSNDQIHLKAKYYAVWKEFLLNHGAVEIIEN